MAVRKGIVVRRRSIGIILCTDDGMIGPWLLHWRLWEACSTLCRRNEGSRHVVYWRSHMSRRGIALRVRTSEKRVPIQDRRRLWAVRKMPHRRNRGSREYWGAHISSGQRSGHVMVVRREDRVGHVTVVHGEDRVLSSLSANIQSTVN